MILKVLKLLCCSLNNICFFDAQFSADKAADLFTASNIEKVNYLVNVVLDIELCLIY